MRVCEEEMKVTKGRLEAAKAEKKFKAHQAEVKKKKIALDKAKSAVGTLKPKVENRAKAMTEEARIHGRIEALPGPFRRRFDRFYKASKIEFTNYHGKSMNGNSRKNMLKAHGELIKCMYPLKVLTLDEMTAKFVGSAELCNRELLRWNKFASLRSCILCAARYVRTRSGCWKGALWTWASTCPRRSLRRASTPSSITPW
jgi:hypothetical protein